MRAAFLLPALAFLATSLYLAEAQTSQKISKFFPTPVSVKVLALNGAATGWYSSAWVFLMSLVALAGHRPGRLRADTQLRGTTPTACPPYTAGAECGGEPNKKC